MKKISGVRRSSNDKEFDQYFKIFGKKVQKWMIGDLVRSTKADARFLVAMGIFNYMEILGGFCVKPEMRNGPCGERFKYVFNNLLPERYGYNKIYKEISEISGKNAYDCLRCGLSHEYLTKTYGDNKITFNIIKANSEEECRKIKSQKKCGIELERKGGNECHMKIYNPRLIRDLKEAFEKYKRLVKNDNEDDYKDKFITRCKIIGLERFFDKKNKFMEVRTRIAAIIIKDGKLLMLRGKGHDELWTPGGHARGERKR